MFMMNQKIQPKTYRQPCKVSRAESWLRLSFLSPINVWGIRSRACAEYTTWAKQKSNQYSITEACSRLLMKKTIYLSSPPASSTSWILNFSWCGLYFIWTRRSPFTILSIDSPGLRARPSPTLDGMPTPNVALLSEQFIRLSGSKRVRSANWYASACLDNADNVIVASTSSVGPRISDLLRRGVSACRYKPSQN